MVIFCLALFQLLLSGEYEKAEKFLALTRNSPFKSYAGMIIHHQLGDYDKSERYCKDLLNPMYPEKIPQRYLTMAEMIAEDIKVLRKNKTALLGQKMKSVSRRLNLGYGGPETQRKQKEIIKELDQMIAEAEDQLNKQQESASNSGKGPKETAPEGAKDSNIIGNEVGKGLTAKRKGIKSSETWGKMPQKEKLKALESINRNLPSYMQEAMEGYRRNLQKGK